MTDEEIERRLAYSQRAVWHRSAERLVRSADQPAHEPDGSKWTS